MAYFLCSGLLVNWRARLDSGSALFAAVVAITLPMWVTAAILQTCILPLRSAHVFTKLISPMQVIEPQYFLIGRSRSRGFPGKALQQLKERDVH
jgi:hypothetical protein